jgi:hypothetical protein
MVDRIIQGQGVGRSIKSAISDKTTAKFTRMKEKFDPLNIGKAFGGRLGAYAVGKLTGRREEDIAHFTGARVRASSMEAMKVNPLVTKVSDGAQGKMKKNDGLADVMARIYNLIKSNIADQKDQREVEKNLAVSKDREREKWHKELVEAITGMSGGTQTASPAKEKKGGIFDAIANMIGDFIKPILESLAKWKEMLSPLMDFLGYLGKNAISALTRLAGFLISPLGVGLVFAGASIAALLALLKFDTNPEATTKGIINAGAVDGGMAESIMAATEASDENAVQAKKNNLLAARESNEKSLLPWKDSDLQKDYLKKIGWDEKTGTTKEERSSGAIGIDETGKLVYKKTTATALPAGVTPSTAGGGRGSASAAASDPRRVDSSVSSDGGGDSTTTPVATASPMPAAPAETGSRVQSAISQNNDMNLDQNKSSSVMVDNSSTVNAGGGTPPPAISMDSSVMVRTDDPTLQNILKKLVRQV